MGDEPQVAIVFVEAKGPTMSGADFAVLVEESDVQRIGHRWLAEIRRACVEVSRRFDPVIYAVSEPSWSEGEIDDLVQDVTTEQLLRQGQLDYILEVSSSIEDIRRLLRHQVRRALVRRRRRTVVDQLLVRLGELLRSAQFEELPGFSPRRYRPSGTDFQADPPSDLLLRAAAAQVRMLPTTSSSGDRAPTVFRAAVLEQVLTLSFATTGASLSIDDLGRILRESLTSWTPVVLGQDEQPDSLAADPEALTFELEEVVEALMRNINEIDRRILCSKLAGLPDSALVEQLGVSRPTAAKQKLEAFDRLRKSWQELAGDLSSEQSSRLVQELYLRLAVAGFDR